MRFVPARRVRSLRAALILCAIAAFGFDPSLNARADAAPLVVMEGDPSDSGFMDKGNRYYIPSSESGSVPTDKDRIPEAPPKGRDNPNPEGRDNPIRVPEPATFTLMAIGLGGLAARRVHSNRATRS
jgi:PEP-CTERM motif